ncbi:MAG: glycosyltransferase [Methylococcus sp.]|nr:glycosyltransferase [Methylococcus sp.]
MKIAFFSPHSDPLAEPGQPDSGGQCIYERQVAIHLARQGHEVRVFTRLWGDKRPQESIADGAAVHRYPMGPPGFLRKEDMGPYIAEFAAAVISDRRVWLESADAFHGHYWDGGVSALAAGLSLGKPVVFTAHSLGALKRDRLPDPDPEGATFRYDIRLAAERRILGAADGVITLGKVEQRALVERCGCDPGKIAVIPGGVELSEFRVAGDKRTLQRELGFNTDYVLFTVGRLDPRKGFLELLEAMPRVLRGLADAGMSATLLMPMGQERPAPAEMAYRARLQERAKALGIEGAIHWFPRLSDEALRQRYSAADLFLCPSPYEPFGLVLAEAFASGTPVVATVHGGPSEIVSPGEDGYLADPEDPEEFSSAILKALLLPPPDRRKMQACAFAKAENRFAWESVATRVADVYRGLDGKAG